MTQEGQNMTIDWADEAKHLYRLAEDCRGERGNLVDAWDKWANRTAAKAEPGYKGSRVQIPPARPESRGIATIPRLLFFRRG